MPLTGELVQVLEVDPDLAEDLDREREAAVRKVAVARLDTLAAGEWEGETSYPKADGHLGLLIIDGLMSRTVEVAGRSCVELLGPGDILRPWVKMAPNSSVPLEAHWMVVQPTQLAVLDRRFAQAIVGYPEIVSSVLDRVMMRSRWIAFQLAVSNLKRIESRLLVVMWHFADRWGRTSKDGVRLELPITHRMLAGIVGAQRPSVTTALSNLRRDGVIERTSDGAWILRGGPPAELAHVEDTASGEPTPAAELTEQ